MWPSYTNVCVWKQKRFSSLGITDLAEVWGVLTGDGLKSLYRWECLFSAHSSSPVETASLIRSMQESSYPFWKKRSFELKAQCLLLTTAYSSRSSCFAVLHSINRKEFTNGQCGNQGWFWFSSVSPTRNFMRHKKHWGFRFLGPLLILDSLILRHMINYLFLMFIHNLADRSDDRKSWNA